MRDRETSLQRIERQDRAILRVAESGMGPPRSMLQLLHPKFLAICESDEKSRTNKSSNSGTRDP